MNQHGDNADVLKPLLGLPELMELPSAGSYKDTRWQLLDKPSSHSWPPPTYLFAGNKASAAAPSNILHLTNLLNSLPYLAC